MEARRHPSAQRKKSCQPRVLYQQSPSFKNQGELKTIQNKQILREYVTSIPVVQVITQDVLQAENT